MCCCNFFFCIVDFVVLGLCSFVLEDLKKVDRSKTPWLIAAGHRPMYVASTDPRPYEGDNAVQADLQAAFESIFLEYKVLHFLLCARQRHSPYPSAHFGIHLLSDVHIEEHLRINQHVIHSSHGRILFSSCFFFQVDIVLQGHHHGYQRTCPVFRNKCMSMGEAPVYIDVGNAGAGLAHQPDYHFPDHFEVSYLYMVSGWEPLTICKILNSYLISQGDIVG